VEGIMADAIVVGVYLLLLAPVAVLAAMLSAGLNLLLLPWLKTYALARPNARSSHREPTPQGGGAAVIIATFAIAGIGAAIFASSLSSGDITQLLALTTAALLLAAVGAVDDIRGLPALPRLILQAVAAGIVIAALPAELHVVPALPWWVERGAILLAVVWFINLTNFMDGIDWMTVAEVVPVTVGIAICGIMGIVTAVPALIALLLLGAILGFAPFNKPVARLFLGDVGSLPIGLVLAWLLVQLAGRGELAAALILPLYYVADTTLTLVRRLAAGEAVWRAHRSHFYQRARDGGFPVGEIVARVFVLNLALVALALMAIMSASRPIALGALLAAAALVGVLLLRFARGKP
jgi:UDP-N-acetylmuramyl pentapeptide phosphotransferase/UDP-N-acetylglucosamine-1-phosphate transferase